MEPREGGGGEYSGIPVTGIAESCEIITRLHLDQKQSNDQDAT